MVHVYRDPSGNIYNASLAVSDIQTGKNSYYKLQVLEANVTSGSVGFSRVHSRVIAVRSLMSTMVFQLLAVQIVGSHRYHDWLAQGRSDVARRGDRHVQTTFPRKNWQLLGVEEEFPEEARQNGHGRRNVRCEYDPFQLLGVFYWVLTCVLIVHRTTKWTPLRLSFLRNSRSRCK